MNTNIFVPKKIKVGFQHRKDTYTQKLAYVIYYDQKNKLRKETSWESWRDATIDPEDFDNEPTSGFVLNKKVGGVEESWGWDARKTYTRIYDPRGFEFEITIPNLLWILENCNCIKGKGLDGQFVYGWDGKELVLIPVDSPDYQEIERKNQLFHKNEFIKAKDLKIGATYRDKNDNEYVYMGRFDMYDKGYWKGDLFFPSWNKFVKYCEDNNIPKTETGTSWYKRCEYKEDRYDYGKVEKEHCFYYTYKTWEGKVCGSFTWKSSVSNFLIDIINENCHEKYAEYFELLEQQPVYSPPDNNKVTYHEESLSDFEKRVRNNNILYYYDFGFYSNVDGQIKAYKARTKCGSESEYVVYETEQDRSDKEVLHLFSTKVSEEQWAYNKHIVTHMIPVTLRAIYETMKPMYKQTYLINGKEYRKHYGN